MLIHIAVLVNNCFTEEVYHLNLLAFRNMKCSKFFPLIYGAQNYKFAAFSITKKSKREAIKTCRGEKKTSSKMHEFYRLQANFNMYIKQSMKRIGNVICNK